MQDEQLHADYGEAEEVQALLQQDQPQDAPPAGVGGNPEMGLVPQ